MEIGQILFLSQQQTKKSKNDILPFFLQKMQNLFGLLLTDGYYN
jgi:hypothetical protein